MTQFWIAEVETSNTESRAFADTPEEAVAALVRVWREQYAPMSGANPDLLEAYRGEIKVSLAEMGKGYTLAVTDALWHSVILHGDDSRFDAAFEASTAASPSTPR